MPIFVCPCVHYLAGNAHNPGGVQEMGLSVYSRVVEYRASENVIGEKTP